jgi:flagellin-like protein
MLIDIIKNKKLSAKRGISSIVGTLIMVAVVASIGSVIMFQGLNGINDFNYYLSFLTGSKNSLHENLIIEHVRFNPTTNDLDVWVRNTGTVELEISKITMVRMDTQELILDANPQIILPISTIVNINEPVDTNRDGSLTLADTWQNSPYDTPPFNTPPYDTPQYRISLTTQSGNSFETTATRFNS